MQTNPEIMPGAKQENEDVIVGGAAVEAAPGLTAEEITAEKQAGATAEAEAKAKLQEVQAQLDAAKWESDKIDKSQIETAKDPQAGIETLKDPIDTAQKNLDAAIQDMINVGLIKGIDEIPKKPSFLAGKEKKTAYKSFIYASQALDELSPKGTTKMPTGRGARGSGTTSTKGPMGLT